MGEYLYSSVRKTFLTMAQNPKVIKKKRITGKFNFIKTKVNCCIAKKNHKQSQKDVVIHIRDKGLIPLFFLKELS